MADLIPNVESHYLKVNHSEDDTCQTFVFHGEDHTLGNSLRYMIMKNPTVEYCGYSVPHPSENKINLRIQTKAVPCRDILKQGLVDLQKVCNHVLDTFKNSVDSFSNVKFGSQDQEMESEEEESEEEEEDDDDDGDDDEDTY